MSTSDTDRALQAECALKGWLLVKTGSKTWPGRCVITKTGYVAWLTLCEGRPPSYEQGERIDDLIGFSQDARFIYGPDDVEDLFAELTNVEASRDGSWGPD